MHYWGSVAGVRDLAHRAYLKQRGKQFFSLQLFEEPRFSIPNSSKSFWYNGAESAMASYTRKTLSKKLGIGIETLRYYERIGILPPPERGANGYRYYWETDVGVIEHILVAKKFGFTLKEIMEFKRATQGIDAKDVDIVPLLRKKLKDVRTQVASLSLLRKNLEDLIKSMPRKKK